MVGSAVSARAVALLLGCALAMLDRSAKAEPEPHADADAHEKRLILVGSIATITMGDDGRKPRDVTLNVEKVVSGDFAGTTFSFRAPSAPGSGFQVGQSCTIGAFWNGKSYVVNRIECMAARDSTADATPPTPLPCVRPPRGGPQAWEYRERVLRSFPPDNPPPKFFAAFAGRGSSLDYELHLWRDARGLFGVLLYPVLEVDSRSARLRDVEFDPKSGVFTFAARFPEAEHRFTGRLRGKTIKGTVTYEGRNEDVVLRKLRGDQGHGVPEPDSPPLYTSRAQFDCEMTMSGR